eukprot:3159133-Rhodomonas_salina.5
MQTRTSEFQNRSRTRASRSSTAIDGVRKHPAPHTPPKCCQLRAVASHPPQRRDNARAMQKYSLGSACRPKAESGARVPMSRRSALSPPRPRQSVPTLPHGAQDEQAEAGVTGGVWSSQEQGGQTGQGGGVHVGDREVLHEVAHPVRPSEARAPRSAS